ncbi:hypothetical protein EXIGLDRAFT_717652 [Exidia glandulosa HHB12029]|uniref:Microbial-type PARG catalytic domain-containing protein n=1 Tax=Exidia glandulosa HHB12029 TaxID=1314781 RepID=A0A165I7C7_EXIGL|nr:hypothetical protein EXIGLDRAFT_717652 [Exidia glandulosa HHB12029]
MTESSRAKQALKCHYSMQRRHVHRRNHLLKNAQETLSILSSGGTYIDFNGGTFFVSNSTQDAHDNTVLYPADAPLPACGPAPALSDTHFEFRKAHPAFALSPDHEATRVGILNAGSASAKHASTYFVNGGDDPEAALLRSSTFDAVQRSPAALEWFRSHSSKTTAGAMSNALLYTPNVKIIRSVEGRLVRPRTVDVLTAAAPNVSAIAAHHTTDAPEVIANVLRERCARALSLFQLRGVRTVVLDNMGADVDTAARVWCELLGTDDAPFHNVFDRVVFAVAGHRHAAFRQAFETYQYNAELVSALSS